MRQQTEATTQKSNSDGRSFQKTGRAALGPLGLSWSELAITACAVVARLRMLAATSAIIARFGVFVDASAVVARLRVLVDASAIIARLRVLVDASAIIARLRVPVEAATIVTPLRREGHSAVAALATATTGP
jgi:hypothetical protein